ncbi:MAG: integrase arm-type DNA-binding domain-containing protein [Rickettsiales bacterium]|jgi:integrase|nr:integrase arm-type DNA-binding domain-containing protein [Rickettsiales bacterium]
MAHQFLFNPYILDSLPIPDKGFDVVQDTAEPRLRLYITSRGVKSFFVRKRVRGKDRRIIIGQYPKVEIQDARARVSDVLETIAITPKLRRRKTVFRKIADLYIQKKVRRADESRDKLVRSMQRHISPLFDKSIRDINAQDIQRCLSEIKGDAIRNRMQELLQSIFNFAIETGYATDNPTLQVPKTKERRRIRPLTGPGFNRMMSAIKKEKSQVIRAAFLMLIYGFAPKSRILSMQWPDLDFNRYTWLDAPLSDRAVVLLQNLPQNGRWVFPGRGDRHLTDPRMSWRRVARVAKIANLTIDDVHKFLMRKLAWAADREELRQNMNDLLENLIN